MDLNDQLRALKLIASDLQVLLDRLGEIVLELGLTDDLDPQRELLSLGREPIAMFDDEGGGSPNVPLAHPEGGRRGD